MPCFLPLTAVAQTPYANHACAVGELRVIFPEINSWPYFKYKKIHISGEIALDEQATARSYENKITYIKTSDRTAHISLRLSEAKPQDKDAQAIKQTVSIDQILEIPVATNSIFIDIIKDYSGSPEYFKADFNVYQPLCLQPEMYK